MVKNLSDEVSDPNIGVKNLNDAVLNPSVGVKNLSNAVLNLSVGFFLACLLRYNLFFVAFWPGTKIFKPEHDQH